MYYNSAPLAVNMLNSPNLLTDSSKLDLTIESGREILFFMAEVASLTNIIVMPDYSSFQITVEEKAARNIETISSKLSINVDEHQSADEIDEGRYFCMGENDGPFEHMNFLANVIVILSEVLQHYSIEKKISLEWRYLYVERSSSTTILKLLNHEGTDVLEVPLCTSYIVRNYSWLAQAHLTIPPHLEKGSLSSIMKSYSRWQLQQDANGKYDSISFNGSPTKDMPDTINLPMTLVATWAGSKLLWGWARPDLMGLDAESDGFSPRTLEHAHVFKGKDGDDPTAESNNDPIQACTLTNNHFCTIWEAGAYCANAVEANSNEFIGMYMADVGSGCWFFTFKISDYEALVIKK